MRAPVAVAVATMPALAKPGTTDSKNNLRKYAPNNLPEAV